VLYLIRHGQASFNAADYDRLSPLGELQAECLGHYWQHRETPNMIATGSLLRHRQTAAGFIRGYTAELAPGLDERAGKNAGEQRRMTNCTGSLEPVSIPELNEFDHINVLSRIRPQWLDPAVMAAELQSARDIRAQFQHIFQRAVTRWVSGEHDDDYTEPWPQFKRRCIEVFTRLTTPSAADVSVAFTSGGPISIICQHVLGLADLEAIRLNEVLANTGVTRLLFNHERTSLSFFNNFSHLETAGDVDISFR